jgi:4-aminobutyrate aminotransferase / (S)-3-amino-2-methylpropionate transaminase / 5-aminovalerate transaminase
VLKVQASDIQARSPAAALTSEAPSTAQRGLYPGLPAFERAQGCWLFDAGGNRYFDGTAGSGALNLGHNHPRVVEAAVAQTRRIVHTGSIFHSAARDGFVQRLGQFSPFRDCAVLLTVTGTEAVEAALKVARASTGRRAVVAFSYAYHGKSTGGLGVTWREAYRRYSPVAPDTVWVSPYPLLHEPSVEGSALFCLAEFGATLEQMSAAGHPPAAVILEPVASSEGILPAGQEFLEGALAMAKSAGALVIFDELWTAMGRCGTAFYGGRPGLHPDIILVGKSVANGFPVSAVLGSPRILESLPSGLHTATFAGHPVGCAAAAAVLDVMEETLPWQAALDHGARLREALQQLGVGATFIAGLRGEGLLLGFDCVDADGRPSPEIARVFALQAQAKGLLLAFGGWQGNTVKITPPLTMGEEDLTFLIDTIAEVADDTQWELSR